ncbi:MAG: glycine zipper domain-containing protein [Acidithiobacillus ferriphilus]
MKTARWLMIATLPLVLAGCANNPYASNSTTANTAGGSLLGAVAGAVIGNQTGAPLAGAAIGAGLGGLAGYGISRSQEQAPAPQQPGYYAAPQGNVPCPPGYVCTPTAPQYQQPPACPPGYTCYPR